jgi:DNA repair protein SbcD/Mre11
MKFAHMGDCHLGGWRQPELNELNLKSFQMAISKCISEKVEFVLITGDFFDNPYPPIDTLKESFAELKKLKDAGIPVFYIAGSHDYSASGKTFLDVIDKAGFGQNVSQFEERNNSIILLPTLHRNIALYGYPGKKSSLEVSDLKKIKLQDSPGLFKILMLHTAIRDAIGSLPVDAIDHRDLPKVDYLALSHLHINYSKDGRVYSGPIFPNNISELEGLKAGSFYIFDNGKIKREELKPKEIKVFHIEVKNALSATEEITSYLDKELLKDCVVILRLFGLIEQGNVGDIDFGKIESFLKNKGAFVVLRSTSKLLVPESGLKIEALDSVNFEDQIIKIFEENNPNKLNAHIPQLIKALQIEKPDDEKSSVFEERLISESRKVLNLS